MQDNTLKRSASLESALADLPGEHQDTGRRLAEAYRPSPVPDDFRAALHLRLVEEATRLQREPAPAPRPQFLLPAAVGAVVAGLALLGWRSRAIPHLVAHAQGQLRTAHGS